MAFIPADNKPVRNAANAQITADARQIMAIQRALAAAGANLSVTGVWDAPTQAAFAQYGNAALYRAPGDKKTAYGMVHSGNTAPFWNTEAQRQTRNTQWLAADGMDANRPGQLFDKDWNYMGTPAGMDGTGGVFNARGMSSNPNYLSQYGITRAQTEGTLLGGLSDKAIDALSRANTFYDEYIDPVSGAISSVPQAGWVKTSEAQKQLGAASGKAIVNTGVGVPGDRSGEWSDIQRAALMMYGYGSTQGSAPLAAAPSAPARSPKPAAPQKDDPEHLRWQTYLYGG